MFQKGKLLRLSSKASLMYNHRERIFYQDKRLNLSQRVGERLTLFLYSTIRHGDCRECLIKRSGTGTATPRQSTSSAPHPEQADTQAESRANLPKAKATFPDRQAFGRKVGKSHTEAANK